MEGQAVVKKHGKKEGGKISLHQMCEMALMAAVMCILGPVSVPIGAVPISLTSLIVYLAAFLSGPKMGTMSTVVYLLLGMAGLPVFSGYSGGVAKLAGPTGGYLVGFLFVALITGVFAERASRRFVWSMVGMLLGTAVLYLFGTVWFVLMMHSTVSYAVTVCVLPFLLWDLGKMLVVALAGREIYKRLSAAGLR